MMNEAERTAERDSIAKIEAYKKVEKHAYRRIIRERAATQTRPIKEHQQLQVELNGRIEELRSELLEIEMKLQDALTNSRKMFVSKIKQIIENMGLLNQTYNQEVLD